MRTEPQRTCLSCGNEFSGAMEFCPVCLLRKGLAGVVASGESSTEGTLKPVSDQPAQRFDHYELVTGEGGKPVELGRGAMGVTYKAFDIDLRCPVTLKVISERYLGDESARLRFLREARAAASVRQTPFRGPSAEVMYQHQHAPLPLERLKDVPQAVVVLLEKLLEKDPAQRFQTPNELLKAIPTITGAIDARRRIARQSLQKTPSAASRVGTRKAPARLAPKKISTARLPVTGSDLFGREEDIAFLNDAWANPDVNVVTIRLVRTPEALEAISEAQALVERSEERWWCAEIYRLRGVFLGTLGADETLIEASFGEAIKIAKEQKSVSLEKRAQATYAEYRRQKASGSAGRGFRLPVW